MANQFSSKNTFKFVNTLYKKARAKAYRDMLERFQVTSKQEFVRRAVDNTCKPIHYWMAGYFGKSARIKRAHELWKCSIELRTLRHFSSDTLKIKTFKQLDKNSGLLAILITASQYGRNFTWFELVTDVDYKQVWNAYNNWKYNVLPRYKNKSFHHYANNYYTAYRAYLHKIGAIEQTSKGHWQLTEFGKSMTEELLAWHDKHSKK